MVDGCSDRVATKHCRRGRQMLSAIENCIQKPKKRGSLMFKLTWSLPLAMIIGHKHGRAKVMVNEAILTGRKSSILGYMSKGERVPEVITTV